MVDKKLMRTTWFPNPHAMRYSWAHGLETGVVNQYTNIPLCMYDEGQGTPSDLETNPRNAAFVVDTSPMLYPDSRVDSIFAELRVSLTKAALETDKIHAVRYMIQPVHLSFLEDYTALDDLTSEETQDVLEMTTESTDRQGFPLYNNVKLPVLITGSNVLHADVPGMDTTQQIEAIAFDQNAFYNAIHYKTIAGKLKTLQSGIKWSTITKNSPVHTHRFRIHRSSKHANPYMYAGLIIGVPKVNQMEQYSVASDTTNINHIRMDLVVRYNEWNENFNNKVA